MITEKLHISSVALRAEDRATLKELSKMLDRSASSIVRALIQREGARLGVILSRTEDRRYGSELHASHTRERCRPESASVRDQGITPQKVSAKQRALQASISLDKG